MTRSQEPSYEGCTDKAAKERRTNRNCERASERAASSAFGTRMDGDGNGERELRGLAPCMRGTRFHADRCGVGGVACLLACRSVRLRPAGILALPCLALPACLHGRTETPALHIFVVVFRAMVVVFKHGAGQCTWLARSEHSLQDTACTVPRSSTPVPVELTNGTKVCRARFLCHRERHLRPGQAKPEQADWRELRCLYDQCSQVCDLLLRTRLQTERARERESGCL